MEGPCWLPPHSELHLEASTMSQETLMALHLHFPSPCLLLLSTCLLDSQLPHQLPAVTLGMCLPHSHCKDYTRVPLPGRDPPSTCPHPHRTAGLPSLSSFGAFPYPKKCLLSFYSSTPCFTLFPFTAVTAPRIDITYLCSMSVSPTQNVGPAGGSYRGQHTAGTQ